jgi:AcrR family transcriptional regulator
MASKRSGNRDVLACLPALEKEGRVSRTFRRLDPERQLAVIDAIVAEAVEKEPGRLGIKGVARRAGVSVGSLYQYFPDRDGILGFAVEICVQTLVALFDESRPYLLAMPLREALAAYLTYGIEWSRSQDGFLRFFGRAAYSGDSSLTESLVRPIAEKMRSLVAELLEAAAARGEIRGDLDREASARVVNALLVAIGDAALFPHINAYLRLMDRSVSSDRIVAAAVDVAMRGVGAV